MTNNDILKRLRYLLNFNDLKMTEVFALADFKIDKSQVNDWLKKEDDDSFAELTDTELAIFLNGLIIQKRGKREGPIPEPENPLSNNMILRKLKIAFNLTSDDILSLFNSIDKVIGKHELSAFFRNPEHKSYRACKDQYLRNFLSALQKKYSGNANEN